MGDSEGADTDGPPRAVLIAALVVAIGTIGVILAIAATRHRTAPAVDRRRARAAGARSAPARS